MKKLLFILCGLVITTNVLAEDYYRNRTIVGAGIYYSGANSILFIDIDGDKSGMPACASTRRLAIDSTAPNFKEMVSFALTAYTSKQNSVDINVTPTCNYWSNSQDIKGIKMGVMPF
ncbi:hypothetical protein GCM10007938_31990 [Vibrio zhanjiangensis]|uniref:Uncharacterized protein n=1 Tax=Vibrio zhanjiangensis TaxID=1046128 RepID=A0ABQ6F1P6_9VIBR|nr:hypothetical protein [Vibrio zhanjiangensis]GLT19417.1 hypothetical protein GCM10007938_31990 [Vibrio zhanjiangensis]